VKNKHKLILIAVAAVLLIVVVFLAAQLIGRMLIGSVDQIQAAGEAALPTEAIWIAPTLAPEADYPQQEAEALENLPDPSSTPIPDEEEGSVPILESPEELAGTADKSAIVDESPGND
jgi:hypothetical protein